MFHLHPEVYIHRPAPGLDACAPPQLSAARESSIRTNGTSDLPECPACALVDAFDVGLGCGNALKSAGVSLDTVNQHRRRAGKL